MTQETTLPQIEPGMVPVAPEVNPEDLTPEQREASVKFLDEKAKEQVTL